MVDGGRDGHGFENVQSLIDSFLESLYADAPELKGIRYDFGQQRFVDESGNRVDREWFNRLAERTAAREIRAGEATLRRGVLLQSLVSSEAGQRPGILQALLARALSLAQEGDLAGVLSRPNTETPADAGVSASSAQRIAEVEAEIQQRMGRLPSELGIQVVGQWSDLPEKRRNFVRSKGPTTFRGSTTARRRDLSGGIQHRDGARLRRVPARARRPQGLARIHRCRGVRSAGRADTPMVAREGRFRRGAHCPKSASPHSERHRESRCGRRARCVFRRDSGQRRPRYPAVAARARAASAVALRPVGGGQGRARQSGGGYRHADRSR
ncbi:MAG: hypothetical protein IT531_15260 [Burkholderiales bacterium]|nr:hypothetical protein [Burkholderiales bacterium]